VYFIFGAEWAAPVIMYLYPEGFDKELFRREKE